MSFVSRCQRKNATGSVNETCESNRLGDLMQQVSIFSSCACVPLNSAWCAELSHKSSCSPLATPNASELGASFCFCRLEAIRDDLQHMRGPPEQPVRRRSSYNLPRCVESKRGTRDQGSSSPLCWAFRDFPEVL